MASDRTYQYVEAVTEVQTTGQNVWNDVLEFSFTPGSNENWLIIATWVSKTGYGSYASTARLYRTTVGLEETLHEYKHYGCGGNPGPGWACCGCFVVEEFGETPGEQTYKVQHQTTYGGAPSHLKDLRVLIFKLEDNDLYAADHSLTSTTETTWQDKVTISDSFEAGDYLILGCAVFNMSWYDQDWKVRMNVDDSSFYNTSNVEPVTTGDQISTWSAIQKITLSTGGSHTIKLQYCTETTRQVNCTYANLILLKCSNFPNVFYDEDDSRETTTETEYQDKMTTVQSLSAQMYFVIGSCGIDFTGYGNYDSAFCKLSEGENVICDVDITARDDTTRHVPFIASDILAASAQSYTWKFQYKTTAGETAGIQDVKLAILQLTAAGERVFPLPKDETIWQSQSNKREFPLPGVQT